jgi:hypothetical protein
MTGTSQTRDSLSLRIDSRIKQRYENRILEKFGTLEPYAGTELERELRVVIGQGELSKLVDRTHELARSLGERQGENKKSSPNRSGETVVVGYRIHAEIRDKVKKEAQNAADVTYARDIVESVMWAYACGNQTESKVADRLDRIEAFVEAKTSDKDAKTRRTESIIEAVTPGEFLLEDFNQAVDEEASGINAGDYAREEYLPRVLAELDYTYHPENPSLFISTDKVDCSEQDPRDKLQFLRDEDDEIKLILKDAIESAKSNNKPKSNIRYTPADAVAALGKGTTQKAARSKFEQVASRSKKIEYEKTEGYLSVQTNFGQRSGDMSRHTLDDLDAIDRSSDRDEA